MQQIFESINKVFSFVGPFSDFLWDFPTNFEWYQRIPILGNFSFAIILLLEVMILIPFRKPVTCINPKRKLKYIPEPNKRIMAKEKLPKIGIL